MNGARSVAMSKHELIGWSLVVVQVILFITLILTPEAYKWPSDRLTQILGFGLIILGLIIAGAASLSLGTGLTATPVPKDQSSLKTKGLYRYVRHPIYSAVLVMACGIFLEKEAFSSLIILLMIITFFILKSYFEETLLRKKFDGYSQYATKTGRFLPKLRH